MTGVVVTPTVRRTLQRSAFWAGAVGVALAVAVLMLALGGAGTAADRFDPASAAPQGSRALATVLDEQGIRVDVAETRGDVDALVAEARAAGDGVTVLVADGRGVLPGDRIAALTGLADHLVLVEPSIDALDALGFPFATTRAVEGPLEVGACSVPAAQRAETIEGDALAVYETDADASCFATDGGAAVLTESRDGDDLTILGAGQVIENGTIDRAGNAALALGIAGEHPRLVWYFPSPGDGGEVSLAELTPGWVNPLAWLAALTLIVAAFWRGRRLGPVVIENLPVLVKTTETMEGRARLYARGGARLRALDALRLGTLRRLSRTLALGTAAGVDDIVAGVADTLGADPGTLRELLVDAEPRDDAELVRFSERLSDLERAVARRVALDDDPATTGRMNA